MKCAVLADIHGNKEALSVVISDIRRNNIEGLILLGDIIDYGPHSNDVIFMLETLDLPVVCNIRGNHEDAIINQNFDRFSSNRGVVSAKYTMKKLNDASWEYLNNKQLQSGKYAFDLNGKKCLAIHGSLEDEYWKSIDYTQDLLLYSDFDFVFSGHSHIPHFFEKYYSADDLLHRNKKKVVFINPGSVGQPRNHDNKSQYVIWDSVTNEVTFRKLEYDIAKEQSDFSDAIDVFYKNRLEVGV